MEVTKRKRLKRELGLTGDIELDIERFGENGRKISQSHKRNQTIESLERIFLDILLPACDNVSDGLLVAALYTSTSHRVFSYWTLGLLYLPTVFLVTHYVLNFRKRQWWYFELIFVILFGPTVDWVVSLVRLLKGEKVNQADIEVEKFVYIAKIVNGVIEASLQLIWTVLLISIRVNPLPWADMSHIPDLLGNSVPFPASTVSLIFSFISIVKNLAYFWHTYGTVRSDGSLSEDTRGRILVLPILVTSLVFRLGCLIMFAVYLNIYSMAVMGLSLVAYNIIRLFRPCFEESSVLGEAVSGFANSLLPTPSSADQRSHNLYLLHDLVTSSLMLCFILVIQILNLDYHQPFYTRPGTLIIGHTEFLVIIAVLIITIVINYIFRFIFYLVNQTCAKKRETTTKTNWRRLKIKLSKILIIKVVTALVMVSLMVSSLAIVAVSTIFTTKSLELDKDSTDISGSNCKVKFDSGLDFLAINSVTCESVQNSYFIYFPPQNLLNDTQCYSNIKNEEVIDLIYDSAETDVDEDDTRDMGRSYEPLFYSVNLKNQTSANSSVPIFPTGFGKWENIVFVSLMICIALFLSASLLFCRKRAKPVKPPPKKISLHSTKKHIEI